MPIKADAYTPHTEITIWSDADFATQGWPGNGTLGNPYVIEGLYIVGDSDDCIRVYNTNAYFIIRNCELVGYVYPHSIRLDNVTNAIVENNVIYINVDGIYVWYCDNITLRNNICRDSSNQIMSIYYCNNILIENNSVYGGEHQIPYHGMIVAFCNNASIYNNSIYNIQMYGLGLAGCHKSSVFSNRIYDCDVYGIYVYTGSYNNTIELNYLNNTSCNAKNINGETNVFQYNFWSNYTGVDINEDGIGDTPYNASGVVDLHPLMYWPWPTPEPEPEPDITPPEFIQSTEINLQDEEIIITWHPFDLNALSYEILLNGTLMDFGAWNGSDISTSMSIYDNGLYNYTLIVNDTSGNWASDEILLFVSSTTTTITEMTTITITETITETITITITETITITVTDFETITITETIIVDGETITITIIKTITSPADGTFQIVNFSIGCFSGIGVVIVLALAKRRKT